MASSGGLTEEQKRHIEENRRKALAKKHARNADSPHKKAPVSFQPPTRPTFAEPVAAPSQSTTPAKVSPPWRKPQPLSSTVTTAPQTSTQITSPAKPPPPWIKTSPAKPPPPWIKTQSNSSTVTSSKSGSDSRTSSSTASSDLPSHTNSGRTPPWLSKTNPSATVTSANDQNCKSLTEKLSGLRPNNDACSESKPACNTTQNDPETSQNVPPWLANKQSSHTDPSLSKSSSSKQSVDKPKPPWLANHNEVSTGSSVNINKHGTGSINEIKPSSDNQPPWKTANRDVQPAPQNNPPSIPPQNAPKSGASTKIQVRFFVRHLHSWILFSFSCIVLFHFSGSKVFLQTSQNTL